MFLLFYMVRTIGLIRNLEDGADAPKIAAQNVDIAVNSNTNNHQDCWMLPVPSVEFRPKDFMERGPGKDFLKLYQVQMKERLLNVRFVRYQVPVVVLSSSSSSVSSFSRESPCQPVYYHIHKNGGSSMNLKNHPSVDAYYTPRERQLGREAFRNQTFQILQQMHHSQTHPNQQQHVSGGGIIIMPFFTFLRDPVKRFLSSVGQSLRLNKLYPCNQQNKNNTPKLLACVLDKIQQQNSFLDEHLVPQAFELYNGVVGLDLKIQVMDLSAIGAVLTRLDLTKDSVSPRRMTKGLTRGFNLTTTALLTPSLVQRICELYAMDVLLLRQTGVSKTLCS